MSDNKTTIMVDPTITELKARVAAMQEELDNKEKALKEAKALADSKLRLAVGPSGGISMYGLQQFPVTLSVERWHQALDFAEKHLDKFINAHIDEINSKTKAYQQQRELERQQRQPRSLGNNGPVRHLDTDEIAKLNRVMQQ